MLLGNICQQSLVSVQKSSQGIVGLRPLCQLRTRQELSEPISWLSQHQSGHSVCCPVHMVLCSLHADCQGMQKGGSRETGRGHHCAIGQTPARTRSRASTIDPATMETSGVLGQHSDSTEILHGPAISLQNFDCMPHWISGKPAQSRELYNLHQSWPWATKNSAPTKETQINPIGNIKRWSKPGNKRLEAASPGMPAKTILDRRPAAERGDR